MKLPISIWLLLLVIVSAGAARRYAPLVVEEEQPSVPVSSSFLDTAVDRVEATASVVGRRSVESELDEPTEWDEATEAFIDQSYAEADRISSPDDPLYRKYAIPGQYIVVFQDNVSDVATKATTLVGVGTDQILWEYTVAFLGVALKGVNETLLATLKADPDVKYIEQDVSMMLDGAWMTRYEQPSPPNWGLDRIDEFLFAQKSADQPGEDGVYRFDQTGEGVTVFVVDSGIRADHDQFIDDDRSTRVGCGTDAFQLHADRNKVDLCHDGVGHGTHVAGIIGGNDFGVAKEVYMVSVKVFDDSGRGSVGSVVHGLDWIRRSKMQNPGKSMIANLSMGTPVHLQSFQDALMAVVNQGVIVTTSAGNAQDNACLQYPASYEWVITVGASTYDDSMAPYSNWGPCVDFFAPGDRITSAWNRHTHDQATTSGASAAAAHTAGVAALVLDKYPGMSPKEMRYNMMSAGELNALDNLPEGTATHNVLLNMASLSLD